MFCINACNNLLYFHAAPEVKANNSVSEGSIRLVGGSDVLEGVVEIYLFGYWSTVCWYGWDLTDATVACHQLGYPSALAAPTGVAFGRSGRLLWFTSVGCTGKEANLTQCRHSASTSCGSYPSGVICSSEYTH